MSLNYTVQGDLGLLTCVQIVFRIPTRYLQTIRRLMYRDVPFGFYHSLYSSPRISRLIGRADLYTVANEDAGNGARQLNFRQRLQREVEPIINHAIVVLVLEATLLLIGLLALGLKYMFPTHQVYFVYVETADVWICLVLLAEFGLYTLVLVGIRLFKGLKREARIPTTDEES